MLGVLERHLDARQTAKVRNRLSEDVRALWPDGAMSRQVM
jgi:uncharacterized protein (DUF2267 family)